ncbi:MAG: HAD-IIB family hydrolase [Lachnospiraceae bacterium]|nr:HAD-IIB family hydrolase [Lachnospiraceae bacterium]
MSNNKNYNNIRMIALDMDGTLLRSDKTIHPDTLEDIKRAVCEGIIVSYCTGRAVPELLDFKDQLKFIRYGVCMSGALVYDFHEGRSIYKRPIADAHIKKIIEASSEDDAMVQLLSDEKSFVRADQVSHMGDYNLQIYQSMFERVTTRLASIEDAFEQGSPLLKANVHYHSVEARERAYEELKNLPLNITFSETTALEITANGASKASGLSMLAM